MATRGLPVLVADDAGPLPGGGRWGAADPRRAAGRAGAGATGRVRPGAARHLRPHRGAGTVPAGLPADADPGPAAPRGDRRRAPRGHQRRHPPRRAVGAHRAGSGRPRATRRASWSTGCPAGGTTALGYRVHGDRRGRHLLGPLRLRLVDPFGLVERSAVGTDTAVLLVVPRVRPLGAEGPAGGQGGGGEGSRRTIAVHGEDDVSTREYRYGDDLRKVHWRATARTGELMVRLEERPWRAQATLLLDTRARAHLLAPQHGPLPRIGPLGDDCPPADSLEWLVEAAASIGTTLAAPGRVLRAITDAGELVPTSGRGRLAPRTCWTGWPPSAPRGSRACAPGSSRCAGRPVTGRSICLLGAVGPDDVVELIRGRSGPTSERRDPARHRELGRRGPPPGAGARPRRRPRGAGRASGRTPRRCSGRPGGGSPWPTCRPVGRRGLGRPGRLARAVGGPGRWGRRHERRRRPRGRGRGPGDPPGGVRPHPGVLLPRLAAAGGGGRPRRPRRRAAAPGGRPGAVGARPARTSGTRAGWPPSGVAVVPSASCSWCWRCSPPAIHRTRPSSACCRPARAWVSWRTC